MNYNIALTFPSSINKQILDCYDNIKDNLNVDFGLMEDSIPHITLVKFSSDEELSPAHLAQIVQGLKEQLFVEFAGLTILPSYQNGFRIEISVLKTKEMLDIQTSLMKKLKGFKIISGTLDHFRPHVTLGFTDLEDNNINFANINQEILRKKSVQAILEIGLADARFEFYPG